MDIIRSYTDELRRRAEIIRDETQNSANTAERVGQLLIDIIEKESNLEIIESTGDPKKATDKNLFSALASLTHFLRKNAPDTAEKLLTLLEGAEFGEFESGMIAGKGGKIWPNGHAELMSLLLRGWLEVPEIRYNRVQVVGGELWVTDGGKFDTVTQRGELFDVKIKLEEGELVTFWVGDILKGVYHDKSTDGKFKGFRTLWFRVTAVDQNNQTITVASRYPDDPKYNPVQFLEVARIGSFTEESRQRSILIDSKENCITFLDHVNTWDITPNMEVCWLGRKDRTIPGVPSTVGYNAKLSNIIMSGKIFQYDEISGTDYLVPIDKGTYVPGQRYAYYDRVSAPGGLWLCVNEAGTTQRPNKGSSDWLLQVADGSTPEPAGTWNNYTSYVKNNIVTIDGNSYIALRDNINERPKRNQEGYLTTGGKYLTTGGKRLYTGDINPAWMLLVEKGTNGEDGINGADGVNGKDGESIVWKGELSSHPSNPQNGWSYRNTTDGKSYVYQDGAWYLMTVDGVDGKNGKDGLSIVWKGDLSTPPANPQLNWAYRDTDNGKVYIWNGTSWALMVVDGSDGKDGANGQNGLSVFITYNDKLTEPAVPTGDGTSGGWHTNTSAAVVWMSQKVAASATAGTWGKPIKIKGEDGINGANGVNGKDGESIVWKGELSSHPSKPQNGWSYRNTTDGKSYVYQDGAWYLMTVDGVDGKNGKDGLSIAWKGDLSTPPANPQLNWAYRDTDNGKVYIWNGTSWALMVVDGSDGKDGANGQNGLSVFITYNDKLTEPAVPTGDGTSGGWHTNTSAAVVWMSQKVAASATAGTWGKPIKIKGEDGINGANGVNGKDGESIIWKGELSSHPSKPQNGWSYRNTTDGKSYVYQDGAWYLMTVDGVDGKNGKDGLSIVWKGDLSTPPANPQLNWAYRDTDNGKVYIWNGTSWALMVVDGSDGKDGANGQNGLSVFITYNDKLTEPAVPTRDGTSGGWHTNTSAAVVWMSQKVAASATAGTWGKPIKIKGDKGINGADGVNGKDGESIVWKGELSSHPSKPQNGWSYRNTTDGKSYVYQDGAWYLMTVDGVDGKNGKDGLSIAWKGDLSTPPANPQLNWAYRDTDNGKVYIWNGTSWALMVADGSDGKDGANGQNGLSVFITYNDKLTEPAVPTGDGTSGGWHTNTSAAVVWMSQKVAASATAGTWGKPIKIKGDKGINNIVGNYSPYTAYKVGDVVPFNGGKIYCKKDNTGQTPVPILSSGGKFLKAGKFYLLYKPLSVNTINSEYWEVFVDKPVKEDIEQTFTTYFVGSPTVTPPTPILAGNSLGWSTTVPASFNWVSQKRATSIAAGSWSKPVKMTAEDGVNATTRWLTSTTTVIHFNSIGSPTPSSVIVSCKKQIGILPVEACADLYLVYRIYADTTYISQSNPSKVSSITIGNLRSDGVYYVRGYEKLSDAQAWNGNFTTEFTITHANDGQQGITGASPRVRGIWNKSVSDYVWNNQWRDIVFVSVNGVNQQYIVKAQGKVPANVNPTSESGKSYWEAAQQFKFIATDLLLADKIKGDMVDTNTLKAKFIKTSNDGVRLEIAPHEYASSNLLQSYDGTNKIVVRLGATANAYSGFIGIYTDASKAVNNDYHTIFNRNQIEFSYRATPTSFARYGRIIMKGSGFTIFSNSWLSESQASPGEVYKDANGYLKVK